MPPTIDVAFTEEYNADVHLTFRQFGSRLMNTTRKGTVRAKSVYFQVFGALVAQQKTRNQPHTFIDPEHTNVKADMADWYVPTLIDDLDLLKLNIDEKNAHVRAHVAALGKKADEILLGVMEAATPGDTIGAGTGAVDYDIMMGVVTGFMQAEVPDDGERYCALSPLSWKQALKVPEFANADYVGSDKLPFGGGMTMKSWMGVNWFALPNISVTTNVATNLAWHRSVVGHGVNKEIGTEWDWENTYSAWSCVSCMSMGATIIEEAGLFHVSTLETA